MRNSGSKLLFSASDISNHLACRYATFLDLQGATGQLAEPVFRDPALAILQERGLEFELAYLSHLRAQGLRISEPGGGHTGLARTVNAMQAGYDVIYQADLAAGVWHGRADFLMRVERESELGLWSYEVVDTKLAKETKGGTVLQLCLYTELVAGLQGTMPELMRVMTPDKGFSPVVFRVDDYLAFFRLIRKRLLAMVRAENPEAGIYPEPVPHCDICRWWGVCNKRRHEDDHLSLVAGMRGAAVIEIKDWGKDTLAAFAEMALPLEVKPSRGAVESYERLREQARVQLESRMSGLPVFELLELFPDKGFFNLPSPSEGDVFFDLEGDAFAGVSGLEYLFGYALTDGSYAGSWAFSEEEEKTAFEDFIDFVRIRRFDFPDMHIYHFGIYEDSALKRLMGKYETRVQDVDMLLRGNVLVDLHQLTKQALRAGVEKYSLKDLEIFHGFVRELDLREASLALRATERILELRGSGVVPDAVLGAVKAYNRGDCLSTLSLRDWLEKLRTSLVDAGHELARPGRVSGKANAEMNEKQALLQGLFNQLIKDVPFEPEERNAEQQGSYLLAHMLDWYWREKKSAFWEYYRLVAMPDDELLEEKSGLAGLAFTGGRVKDKNSFIDEYSFPVQDCDIRVGDNLKIGDGADLGGTVGIDLDNGLIRIRKGPSREAIHPVTVFKHNRFMDDGKMDAVQRLAKWVLAHGIDTPGYCRAGRDLLLRLAPRCTVIPVGASAQELAIAWCQVLEEGVLPVQGPPGAGKSYSAAQMILRLVTAGKRVGVTAMSHKVIVGLLEKVLKEARLQGMSVNCLEKVTNISDGTDPEIVQVSKNPDFDRMLSSGRFQVAAGTSFLWARQELEGALDYLFVDEAGQLSLIDTLVCSQAAHNMVLLGDPQQLKQPQQGSHPVGTEVSSLEHLLAGDKTIGDGKGVFLDESWRMHPEVCGLISELFYEGRLDSRPDCALQVLSGNGLISGAGLWFMPVPHSGNQSSSVEEAERVDSLVRNLIKGDVFWTNKKGEPSVVGTDDILVIAPYNAQVAELISRLPAGVRVGTVDKFQGQEAPVVIFSMATSAPGDAPRGMEFLYSLNRLNVAVSRAQTACILVASAALLEPDCRTPAQMRLANGFCRYLEVAETLG